MTSTTSTSTVSTSTTSTSTASKSPRARTWHVELNLFQRDDTTHAHAILRGDADHPIEATGDSTRGRGDAAVDEIGEEVAVARALRRLADRMLDTAAEDIEQVTGEHDVTLRPY